MAAGVRVWDAPTRLFHWSLAGLFAFSWWSAEHHDMDWHLRAGSCMLGLLIFRLIWGCIGGSTARFRSFVRSPGQVVVYLKSSIAAIAAHRKPGHNPVGGYSVVAMLLALSVQVATGLFATVADGLDSGPLSYLVTFDHGRLAAKIHGWSFNLLLGLIGLHILAILFHLLVGKHDLVRPMITGSDHALDRNADALTPAGPARLLVALAVSIACAWWIFKGSGG